MILIFQANFFYDGHKENRWDMLLRFLLLVLFPTFRMRLDDTHSSRPSVLTSLPVLWLGYTKSRTQKKKKNSCRTPVLMGVYCVVIFLPFNWRRSSVFFISLDQIIYRWIFDLMIFLKGNWMVYKLAIRST